MKQGCIVHFLDVGQGSCAIAVAPSGSAVVIDTSRNSLVPLATLCHLEGAKLHLHSLVLSHNDMDHIGGAADILERYANQTPPMRLWFLKDKKPANALPFAKRADSLWRSKRVEIEYLLCPNEGPNTIFNEQGVRIECVAPVAGENLLATGSNDTCGVLELTCAGKSVIFGGDADIGIWRRLRNHVWRERKECAAIVVPHHCGLMDAARTSADDWRWFFQDAVDAEYAVISVGTGNSHGHPRPEAIAAARSAGTRTRLLCTQLTDQCTDTPLCALGTGLVPVTRFSVSSTGEQPGAVACAGSLSLVLEPCNARWGNQGVCGWNHLVEHERAVDRLAHGAKKPLCRR